MTDTTWTFTSPYITLPRENVDTDQIIPARFLTTTRRDGLGPLAFHDWRWRADGTHVAEFPVGPDDAGDARVLVAGRNFGCGSSREHAVWALLGVGFRAVVSSEFADIFKGNALGNGLLPIQVSDDVLHELLASPATITVDLATSSIVLGDGRTIRFDVPPFARHCLLNGIDEMTFLLETRDDIAAYERAHPSLVDTREAA